MQVLVLSSPSTRSAGLVTTSSAPCHLESESLSTNHTTTADLTQCSAVAPRIPFLPHQYLVPREPPTARTPSPEQARHAALEPALSRIPSPPLPDTAQGSSPRNRARLSTRAQHPCPALRYTSRVFTDCAKLLADDSLLLGR